MGRQKELVNRFRVALLKEQEVKATGMVMSPQNLVDLALSYLVDDYRHYHILPENPIKGISYVFDQVAKQSIKFQKKHGYVPSFVLDGIIPVYCKYRVPEMADKQYTECSASSIPW